MKIKNKTIFNKFGRVMSLCVVVLFILALSFTLVGCDFGGKIDIGGVDITGGDGDSNSGGDGTDNFDPFGEIQFVPNYYKMAYRSTQSGETQIVKDVAEKLVEGFAKTYGARCEFDDVGKESIFYYDSIRYQPVWENIDDGYGETVPAVKANYSNRWIWTFENASDPLYIGKMTAAYYFENDYISDVKSYYQDRVSSVGGYNYVDFYKNLYSDVMSVMLFEMLLGRPDWQTAVVVQTPNRSGYKYPTITYRGQNITIDESTHKPQLDAVLSELESAYLDKATYFGFAPADCEKIKQYILNYVIGGIASYGQLTEHRNYKGFVDNLLPSIVEEVDADGNPGQYFWFARTCFKDTRLPLESENDFFKNIEKAEYQSMTLLADDTDAFCSYWLCFQSQRNLNINVYLRYFDGTNIRTSEVERFEVAAGLFDLNDNFNGDMTFGADFECPVTPFDNNSVVSAESERVNPAVNNVYKAIPSLNGFGSVSVLDETKINSPFIEVVFDVEKSADDPVGTDYAFQVAVFATIWKSDYDFNIYE